jgi:RimJ/RimL family protein N-acetyltransferase
MISLDKKQRKSISTFFKEFRWNYLPDVILEGTMGEAWIDHESDPSLAVLEIPRLQLFIPAGNPNHPAAYDFISGLQRYSALIFTSDGWEALIKAVHKRKIESLQRYAFTSEKLDIQYLRELASKLPEGYQLKQIDLNLAQQLDAEESRFAEDHMLNFDSPEDFIRRGFGFCILDGDEIVSVATTFAICSKGIEIQINTREKHQNKGLGTAVAAQLMTCSLSQGLDPNWDAANERSANLAKKLGYTPQGNYIMWFLTE